MSTFKQLEHLNKARNAKVDQTAYRRAMREQNKTKPDQFPVNNRKARRMAAALSAHKGGE